MTRGEAAFVLGRRPALDGLRAIAVLLVVLSHVGVAYLGQAGAVGVTLFFVLSGFLIIRLLLEEPERTGRINFRRFYVRRGRRLLPALLVLLLFDGLMRAVSGQSLIPVVLAASYMSNIASSAFGVMSRARAHLVTVPGGAVLPAVAGAAHTPCPDPVRRPSARYRCTRLSGHAGGPMGWRRGRGPRLYQPPTPARTRLSLGAFLASRSTSSTALEGSPRPWQQWHSLRPCPFGKPREVVCWGRICRF